MCLTTKNPIPEKSSYNIITYKIIKNNKEGPWSGFKYRFNEIMNDDVEPDISSGFNHSFIKSGYFHSCLSLKRAKFLLKQWNEYTKWYKKKDTYTIYECEIPENTEFIKSDYCDDVCSKSLKIIKECMI